MSRVIKFRAWAAYGEMLTNVQNHIGNGPWAFGNMLMKPDEFSIMQFTGLHDKNGVEIYEGDIVEYFCDFDESVSNHQVKYFDKDCYPAFDLSPSICDDMNGFSAIEYQGIGTITVIGNLYQNPELLK